MRIRNFTFLLLLLPIFSFAQNLLTNGGFESGSSGTGFITNGAGYVQLYQPFSGSTAPGNFAVVNNPKLLNTSDFLLRRDRSGSGNMLVIDGNTTAGNPLFWAAGNTGAGVTGLTVGTTYTFSYWIQSVSSLVTNAGTSATIGLQVTGGNLVTLVSGNAQAPLPGEGWRQVVYRFVATATTVQIGLYNSNVNALGNDFAIDDLSLTSNLSVAINITNAQCNTPNDGAINLTGIGGVPPYTNYSISGPVNQNNTTGVFNNLPPGTYTVTVTDSALPTAATATVTNVIVGPNIVVSPNTSICVGESITLEVTGSTTTYNWTAAPADPSLTTPTSATPTVSPTATTTYTVITTIGSCAPISRNVTVTVNPLPTVTHSGNQTICPGNSATINLTGTPLSNVTLVNTNGITYVANIGAAGTGTFITPALQTSMTYNITSVKNFFTQCERLYTNVSFTVTVVPNGCATVSTAPAPGTQPLDLALCTPGECRTISANISPVPSTTSYVVSSIPYCPQASFSDPTYNQVNIVADDIWSNVITLPFNFCFFNQNYTTCQIGTNGVISFNNNTPGGFCPWSFSTTIPNAGFPIRNAIYGVYQDTDTRTSASFPPNTSVSWKLTGTYPCRKLIVNFNQLGQFNCNQNVGAQTYQIVLYEVSNIIEVYVQRRTPCNTWQNGVGVIGIQNAAGTLAYTPPGRNTGNWSATNEAWRFTPTGPNVPVTVTWNQGATQIGTGNSITVCPTATTTYTLNAQYTVCGVTQTATNNVTLTVNPDQTAAPSNINQCSSTFNLTQNNSVILGSLNPGDYEITYHTSQADAQNLLNEITNPSAYVLAGANQTIYAAIFVSAFGCVVVKPFQIAISNCNPTPVTPPDLTLCETTLGSGNASFNFTPQVPIILGTNNAANYTITFHNTQADANNDVNAISPITAVTGTNGQVIYIRFEDNSNGAYATTFFTLFVNPLPTATISGTTTICQGQNTTISFTGTPNAVVTYSDGTGNNTITLNASGTASFTTPNLSSSITYTLVSVTNPATTCSRNVTGSATVTVNPLATATISGTSAVCVGAASQTVTFTGANGVAPYTFTYINPAGATQTINSNAGGIATITVPATTAGTFTYQLTAVSYGAAPTCSQNQTGSVTVTVNALPTATISGTTTICSNQTTTITFTGTPNAVVTYNINGGAAIQLALDASGNAAVTTPALTANTTYTLTNVTNPATGCSQVLNQSAVVTVNPLPTATISGTVSVCQGATAPVITFTGANGVAPYTFTYTNPSGATQTIQTTSGNSVTISVPTTTAGTYTYQLVSVASSSTPVCSQNQTGSATVTVHPMPTATISGTQAVCLNSTPEPQIVFTGSNSTTGYTFTYTLNNLPQPPISTTGGNTAVLNVPTTTAGTYTYSLINVSSGSTPACSQPQTGTATVTVNIAPTINTPTAYVLCDDNNDGFMCTFDLTTKNTEVTVDPTVVISYHETLTDAQTGANPVSSPYCNINPGTQTLYIRAYFNGTPACYSTTTLQLIVNPRPLPNPTITDYALCDYTNPGDGVEVFTLSTKTNEIANGQTGVTVTYYATQADAIAQINPLPNNYTNTSSPQQIWINIRNNTTGCNSVGSFTIRVNPLPEAIEPLPIFECSNGAVTTATFNLTVNEGVVTNGATGVVVTYYNTLADAQAASNAITNPTTYLGNDNETVYIRVQNTATGCYSTTTQLLRVTQGPVANTPPPLTYCDPNNDGFGIFDLASMTNTIAGGSLPPGVTVSYHETPTDALLGANPLASPYTNINPWTQTIYVKVYYTTTGCSNYVNLQLVVNPTPEATEPDDLHACDYTGQVGYEPFNLTQVIPQVLGSINPATHTVTFYTSLANAQAGTGAITNVMSYINGTINQQTIYVRVETTATGCFDVVDFDIIVDPLPNATQPNYPSYTLCDNDQSSIGFEVFNLQSQVANILLGQTGMSVTFYPSLTDAQNNTNAITNLNYQNQTIYVQTLGIRITNTTTGCYVISTMDIRVEPLPTPIPPSQPYTVCDNDQDGFAQFDLSTLTANILQGANYTITYHETLTNAQLGVNALPMNYININPFVQIIYVRAEDPTTGCVGITTVQLNVNPSPNAVTNLPNIQVCDTDNQPQNGSTAVNLSQQTPIVLAQQPLPASNYTVTYYTSQASATSGTSPIVNTTSYTATNGQTIWVRVEHTATRCFNIGSFQVVIGAPLQVATPQPISKCDDDAQPNNQFTAFDLTVRTITNLPGHTINYYPSLSQAQAGTGQITTPTNYTNAVAAVQTLGVEIITPQGCKSYTTLTIRVLPIPTPRTNPPTLAAVCENSTGSGQGTVNLTVNAGFIMNGDPNVVLSYYPTLQDLQNNTNQIANPTAAVVGNPAIAGTTINQVQYVYIAVSSTQNFDYTNRPCYKVVQQGFIINPLPTVDIIGTTNQYQVCENDPGGVNDGIEVFNLTSQTADLLEGNQTTPASNYSVTFYLDAAATQVINNPSSYTNTSNPQTIYVVVTNTTTGCRSDIGSFEILVNPKPIIATNLNDFSSCDTDGTNNGMMLYEGNTLASYIPQLLGPTQAAADYTVEFYTNQADATAGNSANAIQNLNTYQVMTGTYWIRITNNTTGCYQLDSFDVLIEQLAEPNITTNTGSNIACVNWNTTAVVNNLILNSNVTATGYSFEWYADGVLIAGATGPTLAITQMDQAQVEYSVIAVSTSPLGCRSNQVNFTVVRSGIAANLTYTVSNAFSTLQTITVTNDGYGIYHYSLDDGPILDNGGVFTNVTLGTHTVYVWDVRDPNGYTCGVQSITDVQIIDYPHYFTPNGDGIHDTWNIVGLSSQLNAKIYIFDRYGKLLKQISSAGNGWDGTYNGQLMPSTDYWFTVEYQEQGQTKQFSAHFALKR